jgi:hypothetical protein
MQFLIRALQRWYSGLPYRALAIQELTAVFAVRNAPNEELRAALAKQDAKLDDEYAAARAVGAETVPSYAVPGLHSFRWTVVAPTERNDEKPKPPRRPSLLILCMVFDGDARDVLIGLYEKMKPELFEILVHCRGFNRPRTANEFADYVLQARSRSGYLFRDVGPLLDGDPRGLDATRTEIEQSLGLSEEFQRFFANNRLAKGDQLRMKFEEFCRSHDIGFPLQLEKFEQALVDEPRWIRRVTELTLRLQDRSARSDAERRPRRVAHTKHHGFMKAKFKVHWGLDLQYRKGLFAADNREFDAYVRTSNTWETRREDSKRDGRGLSIKVLDVGRWGEPVLPRRGDDARRVDQDFLLLSSPTFFARDIRDFTILRSLLDVDVPGKALALAAFALPRLKAAGILLKTLLQKPAHPFAFDYHSATASLLGPDMAVKYFVKARDPARFARFTSDAGAHHLSDALRESLHEGPIVLDFFIHAPPDGENPVEDITLDWDRRKYPPVHAATLSIPVQEPADEVALEDGERMEFTPWNALEQHRPLGSINRGRLAIYRASSEGRRLQVAPVAKEVALADIVPPNQKRFQPAVPPGASP